MSSIFPQWAQDLDTGLSFLGFCITFYVMIEVRFIKKSFLRRARLPEIAEALSNTAIQINTYVEQWPEQKHQVICRLKIAIAQLRKAEEIIPKEDWRAMKKLLSTLESRTEHGAQLSKDDCLYLWGDIRSAVATMEELSKNMKWE